MSNEKIIIIASNDKNNTSNTNSDFVVDLKETYHTQGIKNILVESISVPNVFYNVRSSTGSVNNVIVFQEAGQGVLNVSIPEGQYTTTTLMTAIEDAVNPSLVNGPTLALTQDPLTNKITFAINPLNNAVTFFDASAGSSLAPVFGLESGTIVAGFTAGTAPYPPDLTGVNMVYIHSPELGENHSINADFGLIKSIDSVSFHDVPYGSFAYKQNDEADLKLINFDIARNLKRVSIILRDDKGKKLDIGTKNMTINLKVFY